MVDRPESATSPQIPVQICLVLSIAVGTCPLVTNTHMLAAALPRAGSVLRRYPPLAIALCIARVASIGVAVEIPETRISLDAIVGLRQGGWIGW